MFMTSFAAFLLAAAGAPATPPAPQPAPVPRQTDAAPADPARKYNLMVGDKAPALPIDKWVKGDPVTGFEKGRVYVVEFWATWCHPCIAAMPHLSEIQEKHRNEGLTVIGVTSKDAQGNSLDAVERMVQDKGATMAYTVAWDEDREAWNAFMRASGGGGIPRSFIIDREGRIAYIGHPLVIDETLEQVIAGTHDIDKAAADYARQIIIQEKMRPLSARYNRAVMQQNWDDAMAVTDEIEALDPEHFGPRLAYDRFVIMLRKGDYDRASIFARQAMDGPARDDANTLNRIAWMIVDPEGKVEIKDLDLALEAARRAVELSKGEDPSYLDTLATVHHLRSEHAKAVEVQTRAHELDPDDAEIKARLDEFKAAADTPRGGG